LAAADPVPPGRRDPRRHRTCLYTPVGIVATLLVASAAAAQPTLGVVVDQTGLPLPGVRLELLHGGQVVGSALSGFDGTFELAGASDSTDVVEATLKGFEVRRVPVHEASRIVMALARFSDETGTTASASMFRGVSTEELGSVLTPELAQEMPTTRPSALAQLPLFPSVVRGPDGLLHLDGTRPHEAALWIDGFDVTDPVTGTSSIDLPIEAVRGVVVLRDPMNATVGGMLGALASVETVEGGDTFTAGVEGFVPRPRFEFHGFGRIESFFPRAYAGGRWGPVRYFVSESLNFERVSVPGVTTPSGGNVIGDVSATSFVRLDIERSSRQTLTLEGLFAPGQTANVGLSPLVDPAATPSVGTRDMFATAIDRLILGSTDVLTFRVGMVVNGTRLRVQNQSPAVLTPLGWNTNSFSSTDHWGNRETLAVSWDRTGFRLGGTHTLTTSAEVERRAMRGTIADEPIQVEDAGGRMVRLVEFGAPAAFRAGETESAGVIRDLWRINEHLEGDLGARLDWTSASREGLAGPRAGLRYTVDRAATTVIKAGVGRFVGRVPLDALAFGSFPVRTDTTLDPATGLPLTVAVDRPVSSQLEQPRANTAVLEVEQRLRPGLDAQVAVRRREGSRLPTVEVPDGGGLVSVTSTGVSDYRELQVALRQRWPGGQLFVSYVRSSTHGELNDFGSLFANMDTPFLEPGGRSVGAADAPNRVVGWGTFRLPHAVVVTPRADWRTGFPYSVLDSTRQYLGEPNGFRFPDFFSLDLIVYKTLTLRSRRASVGLQLVNLTNHSNPRDVWAVAGAPQFGQFTNSLGTSVGGYLKLSTN
jgi:hypothetical protein